MPPQAATRETFADRQAMMTHACQQMIEQCHASINERGVFRLCLSGGSTPKSLFEEMAERQSEFDWSRIELFWGDERNVPHDHPDSNYRMARQALIDRVPIDAGNVHPIPIDPDRPEYTAEQYTNVLRQRFGALPPRWDLVLLGIGDDAHTASLFPQTEALDSVGQSFTHNWVEKFDTFRQTLTAEGINSAREIWFLVVGAGKQQALSAIWGTVSDPHQFPAQLIRPQDGQLRWLLTEDALPQTS